MPKLYWERSQIQCLKENRYTYIMTLTHVVGMYLSTKIYEFSMNCHLCSNKLVIRTDPKSCEYLVVSGLEKRVRFIQVNSTNI